jgi:hypothetical protein
MSTYCCLLAAGAFIWVDPVIACKPLPICDMHPKVGPCLLPADLAALAAGLVQLASTALAAITLHAGPAAPTSPARLSLLVWNSVCVQQDMA